MTVIAMWSGPRNISTAMMYSFASRPRTIVWDEPFYAHYLSATGISHPMGDEVIATGDTAYDTVVEKCLAPLPAGAEVFYQKHMTHHMLPGQDWRWCLKATNAFLIRAPERVLASYAAKREEVGLADIGFERQADLFKLVSDHLGYAPPVVDCEDILANPAAVLEKLCAACGIGFDAAMLSWPAGPKPFDGAWSAHWYNSVWKSTGFGDPQTSYPSLESRLQKIADQARPIYNDLARHRIGA
jgi:hypothetical protein